MKHKKILALVLSVALLLSNAAFTPAQATQVEQDENTETTQTSQDNPSEEIKEPLIVNPDLFVHSDHTERLHVEEGNDLNKLVFRNEDGSKTMYIYDHPVKYRDELGQTHDISLEIADTADSAYPFRTKANSVVTEFPASLSDGITLSGNGVTLRLVAPPPTDLTTLSRNARRVDKNTIAYTYDNQTTIEYALTYTGFKEDIVVSEYTGQTEYPFILYTNGLNLTEIDGSYYLTDEVGTVQASIGDIIVFTADERNNTLGTLQTTTIKPGQIYALTIVLDAEYLADPNTVYPIRIDPTVELVYTDENPNAIEERTIQSNNTQHGSNASVFIGYGASGINRLLMRFPGIDFDALEGVTVTSAVVSLRDLMCETEAMTVTCYPFTGTVWNELSSQWSNISQSWGTALDSHVISYDSGRQQESAHRYCFDITSLAQRWVDGLSDPAKGVIFRASASVESGPNIFYKTFASSERSGYRPTFEITYTYDGESDQTTVDVDEGKTVTLTTGFPASQTVTWSSSDNSVATVSSSGVVTGIKAGQATITATCAEATAPVTYTVYVTVADGVYYIQRAGSTKCLANEDSTVNSVSTHVEAKNTSTVTDPTQFWQITYMTDGWYCIRPVDRIRAVLTMDNNNNVVVKDLAQGASIQLANRWKIIQESTGYVFLHRGLSSTVLTVTSLTEGSNVTLAAKTSSNSCHWTLENAAGLFWRDTATQRAIPTAISKTINLGQSYTLADLGLDWDYCGTRSGVSWSSVSSSDCDLLAVASNGTLTPNYGGVSTVTLTVVIDGTRYSISYGVTCILPLSGDELDYEPHLWNNNVNIKDGTRCYSYALNVQVRPGTNVPWNIIPGEKSGHENAFVGGPINSTIVISYVEDDSRVLGFTFSAIDKDAACDPGCYKVALVIDTNADYHWYRQNPDGTWSHKLAQGYVTNLDSDNNLIYDPSIANKDYTSSNGYNYNDYIGYFQVSPLNYLYSGTYTLSTIAPLEKQSTSDLKSRIYFDMSVSETLLLPGDVH